MWPWFNNFRYFVFWNFGFIFGDSFVFWLVGDRNFFFLFFSTTRPHLRRIAVYSTSSSSSSSPPNPGVQRGLERGPHPKPIEVLKQARVFPHSTQSRTCTQLALRLSVSLLSLSLAWIFCVLPLSHAVPGSGVGEEKVTIWELYWGGVKFWSFFWVDWSWASEELLHICSALVARCVCVWCALSERLCFLFSGNSVFLRTWEEWVGERASEGVSCVGW